MQDRSLQEKGWDFFSLQFYPSHGLILDQALGTWKAHAQPLPRKCAWAPAGRREECDSRDLQ